MKKRRVVLIVASLLAGIVTVFSIVMRLASSDAPTITGPRFIYAMARQVQDLKARGKPVPDAINLRDLIAGGYIARRQTGIFSNLDVFISTKADDTNPQAFLAWAKMPDGTWNVCLADGSVQQFSAATMASAAAQLQTKAGVEPR